MRRQQEKRESVPVTIVTLSLLLPALWCRGKERFRISFPAVISYKSCFRREGMDVWNGACEKCELCESLYDSWPCSKL